MIFSAVVAALLCAIVIVGPKNAVIGTLYRVAQVGGAFAALLFAGFVLHYVLPFVLAVVVALAGFALLLIIFVRVFN